MGGGPNSAFVLELQELEVERVVEVMSLESFFFRGPFGVGFFVGLR